MLCNNCKKLASVDANNPCRKCKAAVLINIAVICEACSIDNKSCEVCLKKVYKGLENPIYKNYYGGCKSC